MFDLNLFYRSSSRSGGLREGTGFFPNAEDAAHPGSFSMRNDRLSRGKKNTVPTLPGVILCLAIDEV